MRIPSQTLVLVLDGRKRLLFRNEGDSQFPQLREVEKAESENPADRLHKSGPPGRTAFTTGRRSAYVETDLHRQEEARFARDTAELLNRRALAGSFDRLVVAADKRTLGELRAGFSAELQRRIIAEVPRDLVKHPVAEIERILVRA